MQIIYTFELMAWYAVCCVLPIETANSRAPVQGGPIVLTEWSYLAKALPQAPIQGGPGSVLSSACKLSLTHGEQKKNNSKKQKN